MSLFGYPSRHLPFCGCYVYVDYNRRYLPQLKVNAHTTILDTTSRTTLTQTFVNPYQDKDLDEISYDFPLYDGVSVVAFTCTVADRVIKGVVKEREKAKHEYTEARDRGETAGLFEQSLEASDVFTTTIGNVPAGEKVTVDITYLGELKHDAEVDGVRFTIPTHIVPRYGEAASLESKGDWFKDEGISITVDAEMPDGSAIKSVQSPSHPISVSIGTTSTASTSEEPSLRKASATLSQGSANLDKDFIIQVVATKMGEPAAFVETHPTIPNQRALMATLVPKFKLPAESPEIVFMCDRSGSMSGNITDLVAALNIFLKSLPLGIKFNICSFGSRYSFLWSKSKTYSQDSLDQAVRHVNKFDADYGGTEMYEPFKAAFKQRYKDMNLEVFLLTDGAIWDQERLFKLINEKVAESKGAVRVFSLGVGSGASTALIEGVARAGNGFAQTVDNGEKMDKKVVRMLKGALFPHIDDYSLEIKYEKAEPEAADDDDFEIVEKVLDSLSIRTLVGDEDEEKKKDEPKQPISLFDRNVDEDDDTEMTDAPAAIDAKYDHLPKVATPHYLQTPADIPALYPFNRTTVYVLLSDSAPEKKPKSVLLKGTSKAGPLVLEIPIVNLAEKAETIHQLAARKEVKELEEGRGWLTHAKDSDGKLLKDKYEGRFPDMVEREAVRLGVEFQVGGKWCSFVAVEESSDKTDQDAEKKKKKKKVKEHELSIACSAPYAPGAPPPPPPPAGAFAAPLHAAPTGGLFGSTGSTGGGLFGSNAPGRRGPFASAAAAAPAATSLFGSAAPPSRSRTDANSRPSGFGSTGGPSDPTLFGGSAFGGEQDGSLNFGSPPTAQAAALMPVSVDEKLLEQYRSEMAEAACMPLPDFDEDEDDELETKKEAEKHKRDSTDQAQALQTLTRLQTFVGSWSWDATLESILGISPAALSKLDLPASVTEHPIKDTILATACAVAFFKTKLQADEEAWEMLVDKAETWLDGQIGESKYDLEALIKTLF
ncbi:von Willebrand factor type A domain-containing protein [Thelonectria olida]|uniref:von Willebrand factor type A domain-containing protein n=1 Tax=Thelonectria olida TaxID=1576542 RepID=A0A9P8VXQ3_9HYPO|nr:von Willebrand factor type A domain-containing protein [Thelonectria olida]